MWCSSAGAQTTAYTYDNLDRLTEAKYSTTKVLGTISYTYDEAGNRLSQVQESFLVKPGDLDNDGSITLKDTILGLQILADGQPSEKVDFRADVDGDGKLGLAEVIFSLQNISTH